MIVSRNNALRRVARSWLEKHQTARGIYLMLKSPVFWREWYKIPKWMFLIRVMSHTLATYERLSSLYDIARTIRLPGAFVECGVWRGGCAAVMAYFADHQGRMTHLFDSFEGLPEPLPIDGERALRASGGKASGALRPIGRVQSPETDLHQLLFRRFHLAPENIAIHKGWYQNTLPSIAPTVGEIAILRLDSDWYESTMICLEHFYDQVVSGGCIIIDDYGHFEGCKKAVDEFLAVRSIQVEMRHTDYSEVVFRKPGS
jgi:O-methyltransferase